MKARTQFNMVAGLVACTTFGACAPAQDYWTTVCEDRVAGKELPANGKAEIARGMVVMPFDSPGLLPDPQHSPGCLIPAGLWLASEQDRAQFESAWKAADYPQTISVRGVGEWQMVQHADVGSNQIRGFVFSSVEFLGPGIFPPGTCKALKMDCETSNPRYGCCNK